MNKNSVYLMRLRLVSTFCMLALFKVLVGPFRHVFQSSIFVMNQYGLFLGVCLTIVLIG